MVNRPIIAAFTLFISACGLMGKPISPSLGTLCGDEEIATAGSEHKVIGRTLTADHLDYLVRAGTIVRVNVVFTGLTDEHVTTFYFNENGSLTCASDMRRSFKKGSDPAVVIAAEESSIKVSEGRVSQVAGSRVDAPNLIRQSVEYMSLVKRAERGEDVTWRGQE